MKMTKLIAVVCLGFGLLMMPVTADAQTKPTKEEMRKQRKETRRLLKAGIAGYDSGDYQASRLALDSVLQIDSKNPDAYYYLGRIRIVQNDTRGADSVLSVGVAVAPKSSRLKLLLARIKLSQGQFEEAQEIANSVLAIMPRESEALYIKGLALKSSGQLDAAVEVLQQALDVAVARGKL